MCEFEGAKLIYGEILAFDNFDPRYKKLRDEIIEYVLQDLKCNVLPEDGNHTQSPSQRLSRKNPLVLIIVIIWFITMVICVLKCDTSCYDRTRAALWEMIGGSAYGGQRAICRTCDLAKLGVCDEGQVIHRSSTVSLDWPQVYGVSFEVEDEVAELPLKSI
ncbi:hypothetical protein KIW84_065983 [Lathyrus oleraceus]|uniref:Uncharacterized protein n=1 Tax=Pisum sativum TaxID=3888 RepID=A0A9D4WEF9_PEA|nr:hypothetical protein KIW84_065983 [Pisum sativum]